MPLATKCVKLNNGCDYPIVGLGTYKAEPGVVEHAVKDAIDAGYRHIDCAWFYCNEQEIGHGISEKIKEGKIKRDDIYVTTKLWNNFHAKNKVVPAIKESLSALKLDYLDLFLIHWPIGFKEDAGMWPVEKGKAGHSDVDFLETWEGMEECVRLGLTKSIGVSNFNSKQLERLLAVAKIKPAVNQVECHPVMNQKRLIKYCKDRGIVITAYSPLGKGTGSGGTHGLSEPVIHDPKIVAIGKKYNKTTAQVILNYEVNSLGITVIPKSVTKSRIESNIDIFDFSLSADDVAYLDSLNKNIRVVPIPEFKDHKYYPFHEDF